MTLSESWASYVSLLTDRAPRTAAAICAPRSAEARQKADFSKVPWNGDLREFCSLHDGQPQRTTAEADAGTVLPQLWLLGIDEVVEAHSRCRRTHFYTDHLGTDWPQVAGAEPAGVVVSMFRDAYVPFASTGDGNYLCVDTGPGEHHGCVREFGLEFADEGGPLFPSLTAYIDWVRLSVQAIKSDSTSAPRIDDGVLRWDPVPPPRPPEPPQPEPVPLHIPFPLIEFLPSEVSPDDDIVDLEVVAHRVLETARRMHPGAEINGGQCVFPRVPRIQGANMNSFVRIDGELAVYFTVVTGHDNDVLVHEYPMGREFQLVDEFGAPIVRDHEAADQKVPITPVTFTRASFLNRNISLRADVGGGRAHRPVPDLHDYDWAADADRNHYMFDVYCLSVITGTTIDELISLLADPTIVGTCDFETLSDRGMDIFRKRTPGGSQGLIEYAGSVIMFETNGYHGVSHRLMTPISVGRTIVSHHQGGNDGGSIQWYSDGVLRSAFGLSDATGRDGEHPDDLVPLLRMIGGFHLDYDEDQEYVWRDLPVMQAAFALMEALTGVRVTLDLLRESTYLSLDIPLPTEPAVN